METVASKPTKTSLSDWRHWKPCFEMFTAKSFWQRKEMRVKIQIGEVFCHPSRDFVPKENTPNFLFQTLQEMENKGIWRIQKATGGDLRTSWFGTVMTTGCSTFVPAVTKHGQDHTRNGKANASEWYIWGIHLLLVFQRVKTLKSFRI